jgi:hypothetical protein
MALLSFLDRERSVAHPGYSRWLVPPAALAIHLAIGQVYAFSVFKIPLTQLIGITKPAPDDWKQTQIAWIFSLASELHAGISARAWSGQGERVSDGAACDGGAAGDWVCSELDGEASDGAKNPVPAAVGAGH